MSETPTNVSRPPARVLPDNEALFVRDALFFLAITFVVVALVVTVSVRY